MTKRVVRLPTDGPRFFEIVSYGRAGAQMRGRFSRAQIDQISRTVRHTPEVMVKVTGANHLPPVLTDRQRFAPQFLRFKEQQRRVKPEGPAQGYPEDHERTL